MQVCPLDVMKSKFRFDQLEGERTDVNIQCAVEITLQVQSALLKDGSLPVQSAVRIILGWPGGNVVALNQEAVQGCPLDR